MYAVTPAQRALLHAGESALRSAALTIGAGVYQYVVTNGLNIPGLLGFLGIAFVAQLAMIDKSVRSNPQLAQAEIDTAKNLPAEIKELPDLVHNLHGKFDTLLEFLSRRAPVSQPAPAVLPAQIAPNPTPQQPTQPPVPQQPFPPSPFFPAQFGNTTQTPAVPAQGQ